MFYALFYDYVDNMLERRQPFRTSHLAHVSEFHERGLLMMAGAWADPADGALLVFRTDDRALVERFVEADPYVLNGLVPSWRIREWTVVAGAETV